MYYRRKILLSLLKEFGGELEKIKLQKLLFLLTQKQKSPSFYFVPYKYGCFSFQANRDLKTMIKYEMVDMIEDKVRLTGQLDYREQLKNEDKTALKQSFNNFRNLNSEDLIKLVYKNYPYFAIKSEIAGELLSESELKQIRNCIPVNDSILLYSIGYEGKTIEQYVNILINEDIRLLVDVRKNPLSMKFGFSKNQLKSILENVNIDYLHIPSLGINSSKRKDLKTYTDYQNLFDEYEKQTLQERKDEIKELENLLNKNKRIALTCFEADHNYCHRSRVINKFSELIGNHYEIIHL